MKSNSKKQIEGYKDHIKEIEVFRKYGVERTLEKGQVLDGINALHPKSIARSIHSKAISCSPSTE